MTDFYLNFLKLCEKAGKSPSYVAEKVGYARSTVHRWKHGGMPTDISLTKLAEYFGVTADQLIMSESEDLNYTNYTVFYKNFLELCMKQGKTPSKIANEIGLSNAAAYKWKGGALPTNATIQRIADYFKISVDDLVGTAEKKISILDVDSINKIDPVDMELLDLIKRLSPAKKALLLEKAKMIEKI